MSTKETITAAVTALGELALRLELEGAAFAQVHNRDGALLAEERLEQAADVRRLAADIAKGAAE